MTEGTQVQYLKWKTGSTLLPEEYLDYEGTTGP